MTLYPDDPADGVYTHCVTTHWIGEDPTEIMSAVPLWVQPPLDYQIWYAYYDYFWNGFEIGHWWLSGESNNKPTQILRQPPGSVWPYYSVQTTTIDYGFYPAAYSFGYPLQTQDALATPRIFDYTYASNGIDLLSVKQDTTGELISQATYNDQHLPLTQTDGSGNITQMTYNDQGQLLTTTDADGNVTTMTYSALGAIIGGSVESGDTMVLSITINNSSLPGGSITKDYAVESGDDLSSIAVGLASAINSDTDLQAADISATWVALEPISQTPVVYINSFSADATTYSVSTSGTGEEIISLASATCGYLMQVEGPLGAENITTFSYDEVGRLYTTTDSEGYTVTSFYDNLDRITQVTYPDGTSDRRIYDKLDIVATYDRIGAAHQYFYNSMDQLVYEIDALGQKTEYAWCRCGALTKLIDPNGNETTWLYDLQGRLVTKTYQDQTTLQLTYDELGRLSTRTDALGQVTTYSYNLDNTVAATAYSNTVNTTPTVVYSYDQYFPRITEVKNYTTDPSSPIADLIYSYNPYVASASNNAYIFIGGYPQTPDATDTIEVTFFNSALSGGDYTMPTFSVPSEDAGNAAQVATDLASAISSDSTLSAAGISASANGTLVTISAGSAITVEPSSTGSTTATLGGGGLLASSTNTVIPNSTVTYGYDALSRAVSRMINGGNNSIAWVYDAISRVMSEANALGTFAYAYVNDQPGSSKGDARLASISYPNGQLTKFSWYPTIQDERLQQISNLTSSGSTLSQFNYSYDAVGRITQWPQLQNNSSSFYQLTYDLTGQLIAAQSGSGTPSPPNLSQYYYKYDPGANRVAVQTVAAMNARIGGTATAADELTITVSDQALSGGEQEISYAVQSGDSLADIAAALAVAVNENADLQTLGVNATSNGAILTLRSVSANITTYSQSTSSGATETITLGVTANFVVNATIGGSATASDTVSITFYDASLSGGYKTETYTVLSSDTLDSIAAGFTSAINADSDLEGIGVTATAAGAVFTIRSTSDNATTYSQATSSGATETITLSINPNGNKVVAISGSATADDALTLIFYDAGLSGGSESVSYTVLSGDNLTSIAAGLASAISADANLQSIGLSATSSGALITIQSNSTNLTTYRQAVSSGATEQIILNVPMNGTQTAVIGGSKTTGDVLTLTVFDGGLSTGSEPVSYAVLSGDTLASIAAGLAASVNADTSLQAINVSATSNSTVVYITSASAHATTYSQSVSSGATETITLGFSTGVSQSVYNNVNELVAILPGGDAYFEGMTNKAATSVSIASDVISIKYSQVNYPSYASSTSSGSTETLTFGTLLNGGNTVTVGGAITAGDVVTITTTCKALSGGQTSDSYTVVSEDSLSSIATGLAAALNADSNLAAIGVSAASSGEVLTIVVSPPTYLVSTSSEATETISLGTYVNGNVAVKIGGTPTAGDTLSFETSNVALSSGSKVDTYTVISSDTTTSIAAGIAAMINGDSDLAGIGVSAVGASAASFAWSQSFSGNAALSAGMNSVAITAVDAVPNTTTTYLQLSAADTSNQALAYDLNGNLISDDTNTYSWDGENRLIKITYPGSVNNTAFSYDGPGNRVEIVETTDSAVTSTKQFVFAAGDIAEARDGVGNLLNQFFGSGQTAEGSSYFYTRDHLGSVREMTDSDETVQAAYSYDPFGNAVQILGDCSADFQYAGYYLHARSGLHLTMYRSYTAPALFPNSASGRFRHLHPPYAKNHINVVAIDFYPLHESSNHVPLRFEIERLQICQYV